MISYCCVSESTHHSPFLFISLSVTGFLKLSVLHLTLLSPFSQALFPSPSSLRETLSRSLFDLVRMPQVELRVLFWVVFFFSSPDSQILSGAVWASVVTSHTAPPPTPYLPHFFLPSLLIRVRPALSLSCCRIESH